NVGVAGYRLFLDDVEVATTQSLTYTYAGLQCETTYSVALEAFDAAGNVSNRAFAQGPLTTAPCLSDRQAPSVPQGQTLTSISDSSPPIFPTPRSADLGVAGYRLFLNDVKVAT